LKDRLPATARHRVGQPVRPILEDQHDQKNRRPTSSPPDPGQKTHVADTDSFNEPFAARWKTRFDVPLPCRQCEKPVRSRTSARLTQPWYTFFNRRW